MIDSLKSYLTIGSKCWECAAYALCVRVEFHKSGLLPIILRSGGHFRRTNMLPGKMPRQRVLSTSTKSTMVLRHPQSYVFLNRRCQSAQCAQLNIGIIGTDRSSYGSIERLPFRRAVVSGRRMPARDERRESHRSRASLRSASKALLPRARWSRPVKG